MKSLMRISSVALALSFVIISASPMPCAASEEASSAESENAVSEGHGGHAFNLFDFSSEARKEAAPLIAVLINFAVLVTLVYFIMRKPLSNMFKTRKAEIVKALEEAQAAKTAAETAIREARTRMESLDQEMESIRSTIVILGEKEAARVAASAKAQADRLAADTEVLVDQEIARIAESVRKEAVEKIVAEAARIIREKITDNDRDSLSRKYLEEIKTNDRGDHAKTP